MSSRPATRIIVNGAGGRMGARLCDLAHGDNAFELVAAIVRSGSPLVGRPAARDPSTRQPVTIGAFPDTFADVAADVVIDFSSPRGTLEAVTIAQRAASALLVGTTGLEQTALDALRETSKQRAVLVAPNTSTGVAALARLVEEAAKIFLHDFDSSIVEAHHIAKKDAPSGTALRLAESVRRAGGSILPAQIVAVRGGDVIGEHTVRFAGAGEYIELTHRATSRDLFVRGALRAAAWLKGRSPGWYTMEDVLDLPRR
jgi:4-hydroxy-tetrahydrodipicolinate reductase